MKLVKPKYDYRTLTYRSDNLFILLFPLKLLLTAMVKVLIACHKLSDQNCLHLWHFIYLNAKEIDKTYRNLLEFVENRIPYHNLHLHIAKELKQKDQDGIAYCNLGISFWSLGDFRKAKEYHNLYLSIAKQAKQNGLPFILVFQYIRLKLTLTVIVNDLYKIADQNYLLVWHVNGMYLNSKKIDKTNLNFLELRTKAIKEQELQESSDEEGKDYSETQSEKDMVSFTDNIWETIHWSDNIEQLAIVK